MLMIDPMDKLRRSSSSEYGRRQLYSKDPISNDGSASTNGYGDDNNNNRSTDDGGEVRASKLIEDSNRPTCPFYPRKPVYSCNSRPRPWLMTYYWVSVKLTLQETNWRLIIKAKMRTWPCKWIQVDGYLYHYCYRYPYRHAYGQPQYGESWVTWLWIICHIYDYMCLCLFNSVLS